MLSQKRSSIASVLGGKNSNEICSSGLSLAVLRLARILSSIILVRPVAVAEVPETNRQPAIFGLTGKFAHGDDIKSRLRSPAIHLFPRQPQTPVSVFAAEEFVVVRGKIHDEDLATLLQQASRLRQHAARIV